MNDQEYKIIEVQPRDDWTSKYGPMKSYALKLEEVDGWVSVNQKPETAAPSVGNTLYGHLDTKSAGDKTWLQFKKEARPDGGSGYSASTPSGLVGDSKTTEYMVQMLEELTDRRKKPDVVLEDISDEPIDLAEIPF